jgi:DNA-binding beta-propeller fold protein YncE
MIRGSSAGLARASGVLATAAALTGISPVATTQASADLAKPELVVQGSRGGVPFNAPEGIALNPATGEIVVANTSDHFVEIYSRAGTLETRFPHLVLGADGALIEGLPRSVATLGENRIVVADALAPYADVVDYRGRSIEKLETSVAQGSGGLAAVTVTRAGSILAAGPGAKGVIHVYSPDFKQVAIWGHPGKGTGELTGVTGIAELKDGSIAVTCAQTDFAVQIFDPTGKYLRGFGRHDIGQGNFSLPSGITVTPDGRIWVSDELRQTIQVFTPEGTFLDMLGRGGRAPGEFLYPSALAAEDGRLAVAESVGARFQVFSIPNQGDAVRTGGE